jgi:hypothetical protein
MLLTVVIILTVINRTWSRNSSVDVENGLQAAFPAMARDFYLFHSAQTGSGNYPGV